MKNYRPFKSFNTELHGAKLKSKDGNRLITIISIDCSYTYPYYAGDDIWFNNDDLFNDYVFADTGLPVGEEIEELSLIKDKPYIVRNNNTSNIRYFSNNNDGNNYFFTFGLTSLNSAGEFVPDEIIGEYTAELWEQYKNK